jgi:hypothetical protein
MTGLTTGTTGLLGSPQALSQGTGLSTPPGLLADAVTPTPAAPVNVAIPIIFGSPIVNLTIVTTNGTWTGYPSPTFAYQWKRDGLDIVGETGSSYVVQLADVGEDITVTVTATNSQGSASATSDPVVGQAAPTTPNNLTWGTNNELVWGSGNALIWGSS